MTVAAQPLSLLAVGEIEVLGLIPYASNYTFVARVRDGGAETLAVYKPARGERPLWDFPTGTLAAREVAAYRVSEATGWEFVFSTVLRGEGPLGAGSLQLLIEHDPERHFFAIEDEYADDLAVFSAFDVVVNNADRKSGHVLEGKDGRLWAVDHGVTFHVEPKLRTVIWRFADEPLPDRVRAGLEELHDRFGGGLASEIAELLSGEEADATRARLEALLDAGRFPQPGPGRPLPWPLI